MFQVPNGIDFTSLENNRGEAVKSTIEKLEVMKEFRKGELLNLLNKQYSGMQLKEPRKVKENSVVLIRNIANESKRGQISCQSLSKGYENHSRINISQGSCSLWSFRRCQCYKRKNG